MARELNFATLYEGDHDILILESPDLLTDAEIRFGVKENFTDTAYKIFKEYTTAASIGMQLGGSGYTCSIFLEPADKANLTVGKAYQYDLEIIKDGRVKTLFFGKLTISNRQVITPVA